ncbi:alpha beta hydrolase [Apiospora rasikravindrae]|uniref:Alpha beta hydrolase n=1 Tax=Apiospora rasikravindrae TaxID=990691 RepID=A0ABR1SP43_9PEZI
MDAATDESINPAPAEPSHQLLGPSDDPKTPLIICFHGSGESCEPSWSELARLLGLKYRVLLFERGPCNPNPEQATSQLLHFLKTKDLAGPYVLLAHSYGGAFARTFVHQAPYDVAGAVLAETGQEGGLDPKVATAQARKRVLGEKPLSVIRGNSFIGKQKELEASEQLAQTEQQWQLLQASDEEDERMKKAQLLLSKNSRYLHIPDCGHHVIRDRPAAVAEEVDWVMANVVAARKSTWILAVKKASHFGYIIRARVDGLIRYYSATHEVAANFPEGWETGSPDDIIPPRTYPDDLKCIHLRKPVLAEFFDQTKPSHMRPSALYPVAVEPLPDQQPHSKIQDVQHAVRADYETFEKLGKIPTPRFKNRRCDDRISIVRHPRINHHQPMIMKIVEFPETWTFPQAQAPQNASEPPASGDHAQAVSCKPNVGSDGSEFNERMMRLEMRMHQKVAASLPGIVPKFLGLVTERGRGVIGYVSEFIADAKSFKQILEEAYTAGQKDFQLSDADRQACRAALQRLHDARLHHGDMHAGNVLRRSDGSVLLIDFEETFHLDKDGWVYDSFESAESEKQRLERWLGGTSSDWHQLQTMSLQEVD